MSFAEAHQTKANKKGIKDIKTSTQHISSINHEINNLNMDSPAHIFHLQRAIGNQAVQRLISSENIGFDFANTGILQPKLKVSQPNDVHEQEADRIAEQVMKASSPFDAAAQIVPAKDEGVDRKCAACEMKEEKDEEKQLNISRKPSPLTASKFKASDEITAEISNARSSSSSQLDADTKEFMESSFGHDFGNVRIHSGEMAAKSARSINALAYTVGGHIIFGQGQYQPNMLDGRRLLAHELAHVTQQGEWNEENRISRFSDADHHIIEEVALTLANLSPEEIKQIHAGNTKRDYSQSPSPLLNYVLLCDMNTYGGYKDYEHFDDFQWNEELKKWHSRENPTAFGKKSPISHIDEELVKFVDALPDKTAFQHIGNAFHAIEDFFAHSNFIELTHSDFTHGRKLITGSVGGPDEVSLLKIAESISSQETASFYGEQANKEITKAPTRSHARMAKDYKSNPYHLEAKVLAGLVIKDIGMDIMALKNLTAKEQRISYVRDALMTKVKRYLSPPEANDKWWETLHAAGGMEMEKKIREVTAKTPVTKNQCILSPLRSIEASRDSIFKLLGPAFPIETKQGYVWVQVGTGFSTTPAFAGRSGTVEPRSMEFMPLGVQITGRF